MVALVGKNGSGKTSFLRLLLDVYRPDTGKSKILVDGKPVSKIKNKVAIVLEQSGLYENLTVNENLVFYAELLGLKNRTQKSQEVLETVGLREKQNFYVSNLSRGQKQRVSIARAMLSDFELMVMDEPSVGLDSEAVEILKNLLLHIEERGEKNSPSVHARFFNRKRNLRPRRAF